MRGNHAHRWLYETLVCLKGSVKIKLKGYNSEEVYTLDNPEKGLIIGPMVWNEMFDYTEDCILLVLCSDNYNELEYIRDYSVFIKESNEANKVEELWK